MAAELDRNDERRQGHFSLDGIDDVEDEACAVLECTAVLEHTVSLLEGCIWYSRASGYLVCSVVGEGR